MNPKKTKLAILFNDLDNPTSFIVYCNGTVHLTRIEYLTGKDYTNSRYIFKRTSISAINYDLVQNKYKNAFENWLDFFKMMFHHLYLMIFNRPGSNRSLKSKFEIIPGRYFYLVKSYNANISFTDSHKGVTPIGGKYFNKTNKTNKTVKPRVKDTDLMAELIKVINEKSPEILI